MNTKRHTAGSREKLLSVLAASSLGNLTPDELLSALQENGIDSLKKLVERFAQTVEESVALSSASPCRLNLKLLAKRTPEDRVAKIVHKVPKVPFVLDGTEYEPKDIRRFNGRELHFVVGSKAVPREALLAFEDRSVLTDWLQMVYLTRLTGLDHPAATPSGEAGSGRIRDQAYQCPPGEGNCYVVFQRPVQGENVPVEATMYEDRNFGGKALHLPPGYGWPDLSRVMRHNYGFGFTNDWDDAISSLYKTSSLCAYFEDKNYGGSVRIVVPHVLVFDLDLLGYNDTISSVMNLG